MSHEILMFVSKNMPNNAVMLQGSMVVLVQNLIIPIVSVNKQNNERSSFVKSTHCSAFLSATNYKSRETLAPYSRLAAALTFSAASQHRMARLDQS